MTTARGLRPLVAVAALVSARAWADAPPAPPAPAASPASVDPCCIPGARVVVAPDAPPPFVFEVSAGPVYRHVLDDDVLLAAAEIELGGRTPTASIGVRFDVAAGATRWGIPFEQLMFGPGARFRASDRVQLGIGATFGGLLYQRVSADRRDDPTVSTLAAGLYADAAFDLVRARNGHAPFAAVRAGVDFIDALSSSSFATPSLSATVGYRW